MSTDVFPDVADLEGVVADYFDSLHPDGDATCDRGAVVSECMLPFAMLIKLWPRNEKAELVWLAFIRDVLRMKVHFDENSPPDGYLLN